MKILFVHQNFPGQFRHLAPALGLRGHQIGAMSVRAQPPTENIGIQVINVAPTRGTAAGIHPFVGDWETKVIRGTTAHASALKLDAAGYKPDLILAHPAWGESLFLKQVWPRARLAIYCEFYYQAVGADLAFDPEFHKPSPDDGVRIRLKNVNNHLHFDIADAAIAPTHWQASTFPQPFRDRITVIHDGIDTDLVAPAPDAVWQGAGQTLTRKDEVITFVNRNLEPYRGYHIFMRALPEILRRRPAARVVIVGSDDVSYGARPPSSSWKEIFFNEVKDQLDLSRVSFVGQLPYGDYLRLLQVSTVHVYLTYPFVLGWSLLEAMSAGCAIVASDTPPLHEAITQGETGRLVDFFDTRKLADETVMLLENPTERARLGAKAREFARLRYDLKTVCLPRQIEWVEGLF